MSSAVYTIFFMTRFTSVKSCEFAPRFTRLRMLLGEVTAIVPTPDRLYGSFSVATFVDCEKAGRLTPLSCAPTVVVPVVAEVPVRAKLTS